jgi:hypothetical protein
MDLNVTLISYDCIHGTIDLKIKARVCGCGNGLNERSIATVYVVA